MAFYVILNSVNKPTPQVVATIDGGLHAAKAWANGEGKALTEPGDRLDICPVKLSLTAVGDIKLVSNGAAEEKEPTKAPPTPEATTPTPDAT